MGSFDCYCILCAVTLNIGAIGIGSRKGKDLRKRERHVDRQKRRLARKRSGEEHYWSEGETATDDSDSGIMDMIDEEAITKLLIERQEREEDDADSDFDDDEDDDEEDEDSDKANGNEDDQGLAEHEETKPYKTTDAVNDNEDEDEDSSDSLDSSDSSDSSEDTESIDSNDSDLLTGSSEISDVALRPRTPEPEPESVEEMDSDSWSQASELSLDGEGVPHNNIGRFDEEDSFDPRLLRLEDLLWLNQTRALALNHVTDPDHPKAYFSGRGHYEDYGGFEVKKPGRDPNDPGETSLNVTAYDGEENMAFPFHEACFDILANSIGLERGREVNKDVMWAAIRAQLVDERPVLDVDYKLLMAQEQFWTNVPGEEYSVCDPSPRPSLREKIQDMVHASVLGRASEVADLSDKVRSDPTHVLPYDILLEIIGYMDTKDMLSFMKASYHVNSYTREAAFWKHMMRIRILPWFYELRYFVDTNSTDALDYKGLFLWVDAITRPEFGNQGPLMHIANRRRIWRCCQPLASLYEKKVGPVEPAEPENSEEAKAILESSVCLHMPMTMYPPPEDPETISAQFIHAWNEIGHRSCVLDTYWRDDSSQDPMFLVGISITLDGQRRLFGSTEGKLGRPLHIERGEWIKQIICKTDLIDMFNSDQDRSAYRGPEDVKPFKTAYISNLQIMMTTGKEKFVMGHHRSSTQRPLLVLDGMHLVGLTGQIASDGAISRLGLLQAPKPDSAPTARLQYEPAQQLSWTPHATYLLYKQSKTYSSHYPIWSHPSYHYDLFPASTHISPLDPPEEMMMNDIFLWDTTAIEVFQPVGATIHNLPNRKLDGVSTKESVPSTNTTTSTPSIPGSFPGTATSSANTESPSYHFQSGPDIVGIRPAPHNAYGGRGRGVGREGPVPAQHPRWTLDMKPIRETLLEMWKELYKNNVHQFGLVQNKQSGVFESYDHKNTVVFPLNDESITEVHVEQQYRALKLITQSGRVGYFGEPDMRDWWVRKAVEGERFVGISTCFGRLGGWSQTAMMWSHWKLSRVGVVFERVDGEGKVVSKDEEEMKKKGVVFEERVVVSEG